MSYPPSPSHTEIFIFFIFLMGVGVETPVSCAKDLKGQGWSFHSMKRKTCYNSPQIVAFSLDFPMLLLDSLPVSLCVKQTILLLLCAKRVCLSRFLSEPQLLPHFKCVSENA